MKVGSEGITRKANDIVSKNIIFSEPFDTTPRIFVCGHTANVKNFSFTASEISKNGFTVFCYSEMGGDMGFSWLAIASK